MLLPLAVFAALAALFLHAAGIGRAIPSVVPSALIGQPAPDLRPAAARRRRPCPASTRADLDGRGDAGQCLRLVVRAVPGGASGAGGARQGPPHPPRRHQLQGQAGERAAASSASSAIPTPPSASTDGPPAIDWGVYGVPETFLVGPDGIIRYKFIGPLTEEAVEATLMPEIEKALGSRTASFNRPPARRGSPRAGQISMMMLSVRLSRMT